MRRFLCLLAPFLAFLLPLRLHAQNMPAGGRSLLWEVSGNGLEAPSYVLGTIHMLCPEDFIWTQSMKAALDKSGNVAFEMDISDPSVPLKVSKSLTLKDGRSLKDFYAPERYEQMAQAARKSSIPLEMMGNMHPFALLGMLYTKAFPCAAPLSYEYEILKKIKGKDKAVSGVESIDDQINTIASLSVQDMADELYGMILYPDSLLNSTTELVGAYKKQDLEKIYELIKASPDYKDALDVMLYDRNRKWIPVIEGLAKDRPSFIAVGAAHLVGDQGILSLLAKKGYQIKPLNE